MMSSATTIMLLHVAIIWMLGDSIFLSMMVYQHKMPYAYTKYHYAAELFVRVPVLLLKSGSLLLLVQPWNNGGYFSQSNMILAQRSSNSPKVSKNESIHPPWSMNNKQPTSNIKHQIFVINRQYKYNTIHVETNEGGLVLSSHLSISAPWSGIRLRQRINIPLLLVFTWNNQAV